MKFTKSKVIGIVGGMGPQAGVALYESIIKNSDATTDQQHLSVVLMGFPERIADRTLFLEGQISTNPAHEIIGVIEKLVIAGAKVIGIACNTSHATPIFDIITSEISKLGSRIKLLNMPWEVCRHLADNHGDISRVGLMTTNGTYRSALYLNMLEGLGYEVIIPDIKFQTEVIHRMIYDRDIGIKANAAHLTDEARLLCTEAINFFRAKNAQAIVLGCTELCQVLNTREVHGIRIIDSVNCFAKALIRESMTSDPGSEVDLSENVLAPVKFQD